MLRRVDDDVDAPAVLFGELGHRLRVCYIERHDLDAVNFVQLVHAGERLPRVSDTNKYDRGFSCRECFCHRLSDRVTAVGDQHPAEFRITGHFAQVRIILHVGCRRIRKSKHCGSAAFVELQGKPHAAAFNRIAMQVRHDQWASVKLYGADPPRYALAKIRVGRDPHRGLGNERAARLHIAIGQAGRETRRTGVARRINYAAALFTYLQGEAAFSRGCGQTVRSAAAHALRAQRRARLA